MEFNYASWKPIALAFFMLIGANAEAQTPQISSPIIVATHEEMTQGLLTGLRIDGSTSSYSVLGNRYWLTSSFQSSPGAIKHSLTKGNLDAPFGAIGWVKPTCNRNSSGFCIDGINAAFTSIVPTATDVCQLWFVNLFQPQPNDGGLLAFIHEERLGAEHCITEGVGRTRIGLAWSSDNGNTWKYLGRIISPFGDPSPFNITGIPYIAKDGFFYVYFRDKNENGSDGIAIARANISDVVNAAKTGSVGSSLWKKYLAGTFSEPGLGGQPSFAINGTSGNPLWGITHTQAAHSSFTEKYYLTLSFMAWNGGNSTVTLYESTDGITWTLSQTLASEAASTLKPDGGYQYCSIQDENGLPNAEVGRYFYVYCAKDPYESTVGPINFGLYRWKVDLGGSSEFYRQSKNYSNTQGPRWLYLGDTGSNIVNLSWYSGGGGYWVGTDSWSRIHSDSMHPGSVQSPLLAWVAPRAGKVKVEGTVRDADYSCGDGISASVLHNSSSIFSTVVENADTVGKSVSVTRDVATGDEITFLVNKGSNNYCDLTRWDPSITYID